jgi:predicted GNAT family acetyltransferase
VTSASPDRFVARVGSGEAELTYVERDGRVLDLLHTFVPPEGRGQAIGEALVEFAFAYARANDYRIKATCPYVRNWLEDHPEKHEQLSEPV